ncbi:hypothetical protein E9232_007163 [Inquilinus ginsengisoli]|uniref:Uncharacterized protein n=1 Tax=Inquilinus ginsengisoli TaxID=363840 RepID=A0ABU1K214_9PROT|nr:hypothetical protein [Inquilinus ginsengisoli]MDR6294608.1 hypothetical protein [Inquilinus ginsengisoli]
MPVDSAYLARFKSDLASLSPSDMFKRYVLPDRCMGVTDIDERSLRERIGANFGIDRKNIVIVGSAKLGFTLKHKSAKRKSVSQEDEDEDEDRPAFSPFSGNSDVDVAIVSDVLFDDIWKRCFEFWHGSGYGGIADFWPQGKNFRDYIFRGWMRPDKLPSQGRFTYRVEWFDFFRKLTSDRAAGDYKVTAGLYREEYFLEAYQTIAINECKARVHLTP